MKRFNLRALDSHIKRIQEDCFIWALRYVLDIREVYDEMTEFPGTEDLYDRLKDILEPLLSIGSVIDAQTSETQTVKTLIGLARDMGKVRNDKEALDGSIPAVENLMRGLLDGAQDGFIPSDKLFSRFQEDEDLKWVESKKGLASFLEKLGLCPLDNPQWANVSGEKKAARGYFVTRRWLEDLRDRHA